MNTPALRSGSTNGGLKKKLSSSQTERVFRINTVPWERAYNFITGGTLQRLWGARGAISSIPAAVHASASPNYGTHSAVPADSCGKRDLLPGYTRGSRDRLDRSTACNGD